MEAIIIVGIIWLMLTGVCLWLNYRFHHYLTSSNEQEWNTEDSLLTEHDKMIGQLELQFSKAQ